MGGPIWNGPLHEPDAVLSIFNQMSVRSRGVLAGLRCSSVCAGCGVTCLAPRRPMPGGACDCVRAGRGCWHVPAALTLEGSAPLANVLHP